MSNSSHTKIYVTPQEYLALERQTDSKHEYFDGKVVACTKISRKRQLMVTNTLAIVTPSLQPHAGEVFPNNMRIKVSETGFYTYPDLMVVCGIPLFDDRNEDTLLNPTIIIEVLAKSTDWSDRHHKFEHYKMLSSLSDYLLIAQHHSHVTHITRQVNGDWLLEEKNNLQEQIDLAAIECTLPLAAIYKKVKFT